MCGRGGGVGVVQISDVQNGHWIRKTSDKNNVFVLRTHGFWCRGQTKALVLTVDATYQAIIWRCKIAFWNACLKTTGTPMSYKGTQCRRWLHWLTDPFSGRQERNSLLVSPWSLWQTRFCYLQTHPLCSTCEKRETENVIFLYLYLFATNISK